VEVEDVYNAFLYGSLSHLIYMEQPKGFDDGSGRVCLLKRALYGLKQAPKEWYATLDEFLQGIGFRKSLFDEALYIRVIVGKGVMIILVYVDDLLMLASAVEVMELHKELLHKRFAMKALGPISYYLGLNVLRDRKRGLMWLGQPKFISTLLNKYDFDADVSPPTPLPSDFKAIREGEMVQEGSKLVPVSAAGLSPLLSEADRRLYQSIVGALNFAATVSRPDIAHAVSKLASMNHACRVRHLDAATRCLQYLVSTPDLSLVYHDCRARGSIPIKGASDADWGGCVLTRKSQTGFIFMMAGGPIGWKSQKQSALATSSCQAEYIAMTSAIQEAVWLRNLAADVGIPRLEPTPIGVDNTAVVELVDHSKYHTKTKHIQLSLEYAREQKRLGTVTIKRISTDRQPADYLTKNAPYVMQERCKALAGQGLPETDEEFGQRA
jgi:hypothetical protein